MLGDALVQGVLEDWRTAPTEPLRVTLAFLEKLTLAPDEVTQEDIAPLRAAGVSDQAIEDAIAICAYFNLIDRVADALGFAIPTPESFARGASDLLKRGYKM